jgi:hypothetical protein
LRIQQPYSLTTIETIYSDILSLQYDSIQPKLNLKQQWWFVFLKDWHRSLWNSARLMFWLTQLAGRPISILPWFLKNNHTPWGCLCDLS